MLAASLLIRHERQRNLDEVGRQVGADAQKERRSAATKLRMAATGAKAELNWFPFSVFGRALIDLLSEAGPVVTQAWTEHEPVGDWTLQIVKESLEEIRKFHLWWWFLPVGRKHQERAATLLGTLIGTMATWASGRADATSFEEDLEMRVSAK